MFKKYHGGQYQCRYSMYNYMYTHIHTHCVYEDIRRYERGKPFLMLQGSWSTGPQTYEGRCVWGEKTWINWAKKSSILLKSIVSGINDLWVERKINLLVIIISRGNKWLLEYRCMSFSLNIDPNSSCKCLEEWLPFCSWSSSTFLISEKCLKEVGSLDGEKSTHMFMWLKKLWSYQLLSSHTAPWVHWAWYDTPSSDVKYQKRVQFRQVCK